MKRLAVFCTLILFPLALSADYKSALELFQKGDYAASLKVVADELNASQDMVAGSPNYRLRYLAAHNHWRMGNHDRALTHLAACARIQPSSADPLIDIGLIYIDLNRWQDAINAGQRAATLDKNSAMAFYILGKARYGFQNYWGAKEYLEKATSLDFELYAAWSELGRSLTALEKYPEAETAFSTALSLNPDSPEVLNNYAVMLHKAGNHKKAAELIARAAKLNPQSAVIAKNVTILGGK
jgi:tetratricopeptide (TPR) repeat protein